jgi:uncharacterized protein (TIGR03118 family)
MAPTQHCKRILRACALLGSAAGILSAQTAPNTYLVHNLVADTAGVADHTDPNLVNPWGNAFSGTSPFWIGDNGTGLSTLYDGTGTPNASVVVAIPAAAGATTPGPVTGVIQNSITTAFLVAPGKQSQFGFCSEDGVISGWNSSVNATKALVLLDNSKSNAVYKGCAAATPTGGTPQLYVANFNSGQVEVYDQTMKPITGGFANSAVPAGFAPFNVTIISGNVYVAYAKQNAAKNEEVVGAGNGYLAVYDLTGKLIGPSINGGALNSPWGVAIAPSTFGAFAGALLVGNFGDGKINAYNATTGAALGTLNDLNGNPIVLSGLWWLGFGNNGSHVDPATLYFTSGPGAEQHGLLGSIQSSPSFATTNVANGATFGSSIAPNTWVSILKGGELATITRSWAATDFTGTTMPTILSGISVQVNGNAVPVSYVSPTQINFLMPPNLSAGSVTVQSANNGLKSASVTATLAATAPSFFTLGAVDATTGNSYIAAEHADGSIAGPASLVAGVTSTPYKAGETMVLYGTGFGATTTAPPVGQLLTAAIPLQAAATATVGGQPATIAFAGLVGPGLYQFNIVLPAGTTTGQTAAAVQVPVVVTVSGVQSQAKAVVAVAGGQ